MIPCGAQPRYPSFVWFPAGYGHSRPVRCAHRFYANQTRTVHLLCHRYTAKDGNRSSPSFGGVMLVLGTFERYTPDGHRNPSL